MKVLRELLGVTQEELARRLGVTVVTISRWERGITPATFTIPQMKAFIKELDSVGWNIENFPNDLAPSKQKTDRANDAIGMN